MNAFFNEIKCGNPRKLAERMGFFEREFPTLDQDCRSEECINKASCYESCISSCAQMIFSWHFGFRGTISPREICEKGSEMAQTYFAIVAEDLTGAKPKASLSGESGEVAWFVPYSRGLLLATLGGCAGERTQLSNYLHPKLVVETLAIPIETTLGDVLLCVAASFQSSPMEISPLEMRLQKSRKKRTKFLYNAWHALNDEDRPKFVEALAESTANFAKTAEDDLPVTAVAVQESILAALAYERGWTGLTFEAPIAARLVTPQSLKMA